MLTVHCSFGFTPELKWVLDVVLGEFLGLPWRLGKIGDKRQGRSGSFPTIYLEAEGRVLEVAAPFFPRLERAINTGDGWLAMPQRPLKGWDSEKFPGPVTLSDRHLPVLFGKPHIAVAENRIELDIDVFGTAFFMLSRYEETVVRARDAHDRFPASASLALQEGFLMRPIVDEHIELLWACMRILWPQMKRKLRSFRMFLTSDVDAPCCPGRRDWRALLRGVGVNILVRRSATLAMRCAFTEIFTRWRREDCVSDPFYQSIEWLLDFAESVNQSIAFYFICGNKSPRYDSPFDISEPLMRKLIQKIHIRGHEIGLHPSYLSYLDPEQTTREADRLRQVMEKEGIRQDEIGGRQHYLRWRTPVTARNWEKAGLSYDSTLSFADHAGFRCGTCHSYKLFDLEQRRPLRLRERPLTVMDGTVMHYMGLGAGEDALSCIQSLKEECRRYNGEFVLLWHNSSLAARIERKLFEYIVNIP